MINLADGQNDSILSTVDQMKMEMVKDNPDYDILNILWRKSYNIRRSCIRELAVTEVLERFPAYRLAQMVGFINNLLLKMFSETNAYRNS